MNKTLFSISAMLLSLMLSSHSHAARVCRVKIEIPAPSAGTCDADTSGDIMSNPLMWVNPMSGCDLNFSLPGFPNFSMSGLMGGLCETVQEYAQGALDEALGPLMDQMPGDVNLSLDELLEGIFEDQVEMQQKYCPMYDASSGKLLSYSICDDYVEPQDPQNPDDESGWAPLEPEVPEEPEVPVELPLCSELDSIFDENGGLINCQAGGPVIMTPSAAQSVISHEASVHQQQSGATNQTNKEGWDDYSNSGKEGW